MTSELKQPEPNSPQSRMTPLLSALLFLVLIGVVRAEPPDWENEQVLHLHKSEYFLKHTTSVQSEQRVGHVGSRQVKYGVF